MKNKFSLIALLVFLLTLFGAVFYLKPAWEEVGSLALGRDAKLSQKQELQQQLGDLQAVQQQLNASSEVSRETSLAAIPEKLEEDNLILDMANISRKNDIVLNSVNFSFPLEAPAGQVTLATVNANLTGTESSLIGFLRSVEANSRKILIKSITVQLAKAEITAVGSPLANFSVNMQTYYQGSI